ncbi:substrate-binding domain-containing protein [Candidatus Protofrankia datiscae]|uniref:substrate-binding domain-containing protein n=1 Tax=Candidatus Protofrankia datiscae TaxID=2716812 RepID=UPI0002D741F3
MFAVASCGSDSDPPPGPGPGRPGVLRILAGSEVADIEPLLDDLRAATGVTVRLTYTGTLDGAEKIIGRSSGADAAWFSSDRYLRLLPGGATAAAARTPIMGSPVVLGVRASLATKFGWTNNTNVTWSDIAAKVTSGELTYAMTNPAASNSGFSALVGVAAALAGTSDALRTSDIRGDALTSFFSGQTLTAGSSGWLADTFVNRPQNVDGMINYESVLLSLQRSGRLREPLTIVYPRDGIITADYPVLLLDPARRDEYTRVVNWLRSPAVQQRLQTDTNRRPAVPGVALDPRFPATRLIELPFPATQAVADELLSSYFDRFRRPSHAIFVLDGSGSMAGQRMADLKSALAGLTGTDTSLSGRFTRFRGREKITLLLFNSSVGRPREFTVTDTQASSPDLAAIRSYIDGLQVQGGNSHLLRAHGRVPSRLRHDRPRARLPDIDRPDDGRREQHRAVSRAVPRRLPGASSTGSGRPHVLRHFRRGTPGRPALDRHRHRRRHVRRADILVDGRVQGHPWLSVTTAAPVYATRAYAALWGAGPLVGGGGGDGDPAAAA